MGGSLGASFDESLGAGAASAAAADVPLHLDAVAAMGHLYSTNAERGIFRSLDGGKTFQKVLYKDEYTSGNDVHIDPSDPNTVYAAMWVQQQSYIEGGAFGGTGGGIFKSTDGGTTWKPLTDGLPDIIQANLAISISKIGRASCRERV